MKGVYTYNPQKSFIYLNEYIKPSSMQEFKLLLQIADQDSLNQALYEASRKNYDTREYVLLLLTQGAWISYLTLKNAFDQNCNNSSNITEHNRAKTNYGLMIDHLTKNPEQMNFAILNFLFKEDTAFFWNEKCTFSQRNLFDMNNVDAKSLEQANIKIKIIKTILQQGVPTEQLKLEYFDNKIKAYVVQARIINKLFTGEISNAAQILKNIIEKAAKTNNSSVDYELIIGCFNTKIGEVLKKNNQNILINLLKKMEDNGFFKVWIESDESLGNILFKNSPLKLIWENFDSYKYNKITPLKFIVLKKIINNIDWQKLKKDEEFLIPDNAKAIDYIAELFNSLKLGFEVSTVSELYKLPMIAFPIKKIITPSVDNILDLYPQQHPVIGETNFGTQEHLEYCF